MTAVKAMRGLVAMINVAIGVPCEAAGRMGDGLTQIISRVASIRMKVDVVVMVVINVRVSVRLTFDAKSAMSENIERDQKNKAFHCGSQCAKKIRIASTPSVMEAVVNTMPGSIAMIDVTIGVSRETTGRMGVGLTQIVGRVASIGREIALLVVAVVINVRVHVRLAFNVRRAKGENDECE